MRPIREFARLACQNAVDGSPLDLLSRRTSHSSLPSTASSNTPELEKIDDGANNKAFGQSFPKDISKVLLDEAITLLFAGQDTSAATLSWTLHLLSLNPKKQQRAAEEVRSVIENSDSSATAISKSMISQMPYLDAVIKESMRLYPVAPFIVRKLTTDITIPTDAQVTKNSNSNNNNGSKKTISLHRPLHAYGSTPSIEIHDCGTNLTNFSLNGG